MGTNFYLCHVPTVKEHIEMQELLAKKQYETLKNKIEESTREYHIGKRSCGWQFLFEAGIGENCTGSRLYKESVIILKFKFIYHSSFPLPRSCAANCSNLNCLFKLVYYLPC